MPQYIKLDEVASDLMHLLAKNIREKRTSLHMSQAELAERSGIGPSHISFMENARTNPTIESLEQIAKALNCSVIDLLS